MSRNSESSQRDGSQESSTVVIRLSGHGFGSGELVVPRVGKGDGETDNAHFQIPEQLDEILRFVHHEISKGNRHFIVDFSLAISVNSAGLGWLREILTEIADSGGVPVLIVNSKTILEILKITELSQAVQVCYSMEDGKKYLEQNSI